MSNGNGMKQIVDVFQEALFEAMDEIERLEAKIAEIRKIAMKGSISNQERVRIVEICDGNGKQ